MPQTTMFSPGARFLARNSPKVLVPTGLAYLACELFQISLAWTVLLCSLGAPLWITLKLWWYDLMIERELHKHGAQLVPKFEGKWPMNVDLLSDLQESLETGYPGDLLDDAEERLGLVFNTKFFGYDMIWTSDPRHIKLILATDFEGYGKGDRFTDVSRDLLGEGVFNVDGDTWKFHRKITRPFFAKDRISDLQIFGKYTDSAIAQVKAHLKEGYPVDIQDMMTRITLDSGTSYLFGNCVDSLSAGLLYPENSAGAVQAGKRTHYSDVFSKAFSAGQQKLSDRLCNGRAWPLSEMTKNSLHADTKVVHEFLDPILTSAIERQRKTATGEEEKGSTGDEDTLLSYLVTQSSDYNLLRDELLNILIAARDTTASLVTFVFYFFSQHPETLKRLRAEIAAQCGADRPTYEDIKEMKYMRAVINETLRLFPPVPFNTRETLRSTTWPPIKEGDKPFYLPEATVICYSVFFMHRNKDLWGPDAMLFDPDRFLDERLHKYLTPNPFIFLPFNAGPRLCLGQQFAYNQASYIITRLLQSFESVELAPEAQPAGTLPPSAWKLDRHDKRKVFEQFYPKAHLTMYANGGLWVNMRQVQS